MLPTFQNSNVIRPLRAGSNEQLRFYNIYYVVTCCFEIQNRLHGAGARHFSSTLSKHREQSRVIVAV
jgi:hypothetical protein